MIPAELLTTTISTYRPFGSASPVLTNTPCRLIPDLPCGRGSGIAGNLLWSHYLDVQPGTDIVSGCSRAPASLGWVYADGDEVRTPATSPTDKLVVVWTEVRNQGTPDEFLRVYCAWDSYL